MKKSPEYIVYFGNKDPFNIAMSAIVQNRILQLYNKETVLIPVIIEDYFDEKSHISSFLTKLELILGAKKTEYILIYDITKSTYPDYIMEIISERGEDNNNTCLIDFTAFLIQPPSTSPLLNQV